MNRVVAATRSKLENGARRGVARIGQQPRAKTTALSSGGKKVPSLGEKGRDVIAAFMIQPGLIGDGRSFSVSAHHAHRRDRRDRHGRDRRSRPDVRHDLRVLDHGHHRDVRRGHHDHRLSIVARP